MSRRERLLTLAFVILALGVMTMPVAAQVFPGATAVPAEPPPTWEEALRALWRLPLAAFLASILALRPRRRGTPPRDLAVIHSQIILAVVGVLVMLVVGTSLARAFGIVGAAGLVRYRAKVNDPKDAGVMLSTLAIGLASGVGIWMLAVFTTVFVVGLLWFVESFENARAAFDLKIEAKDPAALRPAVEELLARNRLEFSMRTISNEEVIYEVQLPIDKKTDRMSNAILKIDPENATGVEWKKKEKK